MPRSFFPCFAALIAIIAYLCTPAIDRIESDEVFTLVFLLTHFAAFLLALVCADDLFHWRAARRSMQDALQKQDDDELPLEGEAS